MFQTYKKLQANSSNNIVYFKKNKRIVKSFNDFYNDIEICISRLNNLKKSKTIENIAIIGPTSYYWMVIDHACIKGGFKSIAIPESYSVNNIKEIYSTTKIDCTLCDEDLKEKLSTIDMGDLFFFNCTEELNADFDILESSTIQQNNGNNIIREDYTTVFSSGTSEKVKKINWNFHKIESKRSINDRIRFIVFLIGYKFSFWSRKDNKVIIFMPFSHPINRSIATRALIQKINIIISDPKNCFKHIITEKPNIMFAVPPVYEAMAQNIKMRIKKFTGLKQMLFHVFNSLGINTLGNNNPIKNIFSLLLFKKIKKIYGGKADYFVTGSAPINPEVLKIFYSIGVKVYEAYGQTESTNIMNDRRNFRIGSVGRPKKGSAKISSEGELLLKYEEKYHVQNKDILHINDNWIHTGDLAHMDKDGFIFILGRKDDTIILENGKKINPFSIESKLMAHENISHAIVFSQDKLKMKVILSCTINSNGNEIQRLKNFNNELSSYERIHSALIINEPFTVENGLLTSTLKLKRKAIIEKYGQEEFEIV